MGGACSRFKCCFIASDRNTNGEVRAHSTVINSKARVASCSTLCVCSSSEGGLVGDKGKFCSSRLGLTSPSCGSGVSVPNLLNRSTGLGVRITRGDLIGAAVDIGIGKTKVDRVNVLPRSKGPRCIRTVIRRGVVPFAPTTNGDLGLRFICGGPATSICLCRCLVDTGYHLRGGKDAPLTFHGTSCLTTRNGRACHLGNCSANSII